MEFVDFRSLRRGADIELVFPSWRKGEAVAFLSPHDDDVLLGAGYLLLATIRNGGTPHVLIFCRGDAGYSAAREKRSVVGRRRREAVRAYGSLDVPDRNIRFYDVPDFSLGPYVNRALGRGLGLFEELVRFQREKKISRIVFSSGHYEHWDHTAVYDMGRYTTPQAGDPMLADLGDPFACRSFLCYSVWGDFGASDAGPKGLRADLGILAGEEEEAGVLRAIQEFASQKKIIKEIVGHRSRRRSDQGFLELYQSPEVRRPVDFRPYVEALRSCRKT